MAPAAGGAAPAAGSPEGASLRCSAAPSQAAAVRPWQSATLVCGVPPAGGATPQAGTISGGGTAHGPQETLGGHTPGDPFPSPLSDSSPGARGLCALLAELVRPGPPKLLAELVRQAPLDLLPCRMLAVGAWNGRHLGRPLVLTACLALFSWWWVGVWWWQEDAWPAMVAGARSGGGARARASPSHGRSAGRSWLQESRGEVQRCFSGPDPRPSEGRPSQGRGCGAGQRQQLRTGRSACSPSIWVPSSPWQPNSRRMPPGWRGKASQTQGRLGSGSGLSAHEIGVQRRSCPSPRQPSLRSSCCRPHCFQRLLMAEGALPLASPPSGRDAGFQCGGHRRAQGQWVGGILQEAGLSGGLPAGSPCRWRRLWPQSSLRLGERTGEGQTPARASPVAWARRRRSRGAGRGGTLVGAGRRVGRCWAPRPAPRRYSCWRQTGRSTASWLKGR